MQDEITWKLSLLVDDELPPDEAIVLLERIHQDPDLRIKWYQYQTIRHALKNGEGLFPQAEFLERIQLALETEPSLQSEEKLEPAEARTGRFNLNAWFTVPLALAAAIVVMVLFRNQTELNPPDMQPLPALAVEKNHPRNGVLKVATSAQNEPTQPIPAPTVDKAVSRELARQSERIVESVLPPSFGTSMQPGEEFLLEHSENGLYQAGPQHMLSYARIISHDSR